jgi:hypothetical protein
MMLFGGAGQGGNAAERFERLELSMISAAFAFIL